jgi:hypothetical protein
LILKIYGKNYKKWINKNLTHASWHRLHPPLTVNLLHLSLTLFFYSLSLTYSPFPQFNVPFEGILLFFFFFFSLPQLEGRGKRRGERGEGRGGPKFRPCAIG